MLRRLHDASSEAFGVDDGTVLCHGDPGPNDFVFRAGEPIAMIDFADIRWGEPLDELAYFAWLWCVSAREFWPPVQSQAARATCSATTSTPTALSSSEASANSRLVDSR